MSTIIDRDQLFKTPKSGLPLAQLLGIQTYTFFQGSGSYRDAQQEAFIDNKIGLPKIDYPRLTNRQLVINIDQLKVALNDFGSSCQSDEKELLQAIINYRIEELEWLLALGDLSRNHQNLSDGEIGNKTRIIQAMNESLYGKPEESTANAIIAGIWSRIDENHTIVDGGGLRAELEQGFSVFSGGWSFNVPGLENTQTDSLPRMPTNLMDWLKGKLEHDYSQIIRLVQHNWDEVITQRAENRGIFTPEDMVHIFAMTHKVLDPTDESGIRVLYDKSVSSLSWESSQMAIVVGGRRHLITDPLKMVGKIMHEYVVHAGRAVGGLSSNVPILGIGAFTADKDDRQRDYLAFEEGLASTCELSFSQQDDPWSYSQVELYLAIALAYRGYDFRQVYETLWRIRALTAPELSSRLVSEKEISDCKNRAYKSVLRVFRGTPTDMRRTGADGAHRVLTYNKDLAYVTGRLKIIEFWGRYQNNQEMLDMAFRAKIDPLNGNHLRIARRALLNK